MPTISIFFFFEIFSSSHSLSKNLEFRSTTITIRTFKNLNEFSLLTIYFLMKSLIYQNLMKTILNTLKPTHLDTEKVNIHEELRFKVFMFFHSRNKQIIFITKLLFTSFWLKKHQLWLFVLVKNVFPRIPPRTSSTLN